METKLIEVCDAIFIDISIERNDSTDINCGGPAILGYEFHVSPDEDVDDLKIFLTKCIKKNKMPLMGISTYIRKDISISNLWTRDMIESYIRKNVIY